MKLEVFDPAMCCSTGTCGPEVDPVLVRFAADLDWLKGQGVEVTRVNLSQQPDAFANNETVMKAMREDGVAKLPFFLVDGCLAGLGAYPNRAQLVQLVGLDTNSNPEALPVQNGTSCCAPGCCS